MDPLVQWAFNNTYYKSVFVLEYDTHASIDNQEERIIFPGCYPPDVFGSAQQLHLLFSLEGGFWSRYAEVNGLPQKTVRPDVDFMCHSEGGIVTRRYLQEWAPKSAASHYPDVKRVRAFVSMASPQAGIPLGSVGTIGCDQGAQDMEEGSCQIASLNGGTALKAGDEGSGVILVDDFASTRVFTIGAYNDIVVGLKGMSASPRFLSNKHPNRRLIVDIPGGLCLTSPWCDHETIHTSFTLGCVRWAMGEAIDYGGNHNWSNSPPTSTKDFVDRWLFPFTSVSQASGDPWIEGEPASIEIDHTGHSHPPQGMLVEISLDDGLTWDSLKTMPPKIVSGSVPGQGQAGIVRVDIPALPMVPSGSGTSAIARLRVWDGMFYAKESPDLTIARLTIQSVSPPEAQSGESLVLTASGTGFSSDSQMRLQGSKTILGTGEQASPQGTSISAQFDLAGALEGFYSVVVTNPSGKETTLQGGFQITLETGDPTAQWTAPPPASVQVGQSFQVAWTTSGNPDHVNIHWHPTDPLGPGNGFGPPDTTNSSTFSPTPSPYTLVTPTKNIDGSPITLPTTVKYVVHVKNSSTGAEGSSAIVSVILTPSPLTAQWTVPPPASVQVGQSFQVAWTTSGSLDHVNIHWHPTDPLGPGNGFGPPDTTNSSTLSPTPSPYTLVAPTKNIDGSPITVPTTVKYVVHVKNTPTGAEGSSAIVPVILTPSPVTAQWTVPPPASVQVGQSFQVAWTTAGSPDHVNIHWHPTDPLGPGNGFGPPDTTNSSTLSPTHSPYMLVAPTKNIDGSPITVPTTVKYVVHVKNTSTGAEGSSAIVSVILTPSPLTAQWTVPPPASAQVGQSFQVAWTTSGSPDHVNIHWHPTDPLGPGNGFGPPDTTNSSTLSPTPSPYTLVAPTKNIDGSPITVPTTVKYVVHVKNTSTGAEGSSAIVSVILTPSPLTAQWTVPPPASAQVGQSFQVAWTTSGNPDHVNIHWHPTDPLGPGNGFGPPDTTNSSTLSPTPSPYTLVAPTKNIDGSPITVPTMVKYVVHVKKSSPGAEGNSAIVSVTVNP